MSGTPHSSPARHCNRMHSHSGYMPRETDGSPTSPEVLATAVRDTTNSSHSKERPRHIQQVTVLTRSSVPRSHDMLEILATAVYKHAHIGAAAAHKVHRTILAARSSHLQHTRPITPFPQRKHVFSQLQYTTLVHCTIFSQQRYTTCSRFSQQQYTSMPT